MSNDNNAPVQEVSELLQIRRDKLAELQQRGKDPFQITKYDVTHHSEEIKADFAALEGKTVSIADTMLATGTSLVDCIRVLKEKGGEPARMHLVCAIASAKAVENLQRVLSDDVTLWAATIDEELNSKAYIVPGLGDAGDLCFGEKL